MKSLWDWHIKCQEEKKLQQTLHRNLDKNLLIHVRDVMDIFSRRKYPAIMANMLVISQLFLSNWLYFLQYIELNPISTRRVLL